MKIPLLSSVLVAILVCLAGAQTYPKGDLNESYKVDLADLQLFAQEWLDAGCSAPNCSADLDGVPGVNLKDFAVMAANWLVRGRIPLAINEFMARNNSLSGIHDEWGDYDDWIEIYNYGEDAIDIGGMWVTDNLDAGPRWQIPRGSPAVTTIASGGYLLLWADNEIGEGVLHVPFALDGGGEDIGLYDADRNLIDSIEFGSQQQNKSYGRLPNGSASWQILDSPTPRGPNRGAPIAVVINEIMYHPYHLWDETNNLYAPENMGLEYIELWNRGIEAVNLKDWQFVDGVDFVFPNVTLNAGQYLAVAADVNAFKAKYPSVTNVIGGWSGRLANSGEHIVLIDNGGATIDWVGYADEGDWAERLLGPPEENNQRGWIWSDLTDGGGSSLELINAALPNEYGQNWAASSTNNGTPGAINSAIDNDIAPLIVDATHSPIIPGPNDTVLVTAHIIDELTTGITVSLHYRIDRSQYQGVDVYPHYVASDYNNIAMFDDGAHDDESAGDGIYGVRIPAHPDKTIIEFFIEARDTGNNSRTWPAPSTIDGIPEQVTNLLYQVDKAFDPNAPWTPGKQPIYYIIMTEMERGRLQDIGDHSTLQGPDSQMNATFISVDGVDMKLRYNLGIRNRGHGTRRDDPMNYHVNFPHDRPWKDVTAINLITNYSWVWVAGGAVFKMAGIAQPDSFGVQVRVNGQNLAPINMTRTQGSYAHVEVVNSDWATNHFPDDPDGNAYKCMRNDSGQQANLSYLGTNPNSYRPAYSKETNVAEDNWSDLIRLTYVLNNTPDSNYVEEVSRNVNVEEWLRFFAVNNLVDNREASIGTGTGDEYFMYCGLEDPRFLLIGHDLESMLGAGDEGAPSVLTAGIFRATTLAAINRFLKHPQFVPRYYWHLKNLIETTFSAEQINPLLDEVLDGWATPDRITAMKNFVVQCNTYILSHIPLAFTMQSDLTQSNGYYKTTSNTTTVYGYADAINTRSVLVNGQLATWQAVEGRWSISNVALKPGINRIIVRTFDGPNGSGNELKNGYIDIWYDDGSDLDISGTIIINRTLDAASGPWHVIDNITVPTGVTLTIQPGTTLFFDAGKTITVNGRLIAEGTELARIRLTKIPGGGNWAGLQFLNASQQSRLAYVDMEYCDAGDCAIKADYAAVYMDNVIWGNHTKQYLTFDDSSMILKNSVLPSLTGAELVHYWGFPANGYALFEGNWFGTTTGYSDIIDLTGGQRPGPIAQFINNIFTGASDDCIDLDAADAHVEGNVFMHVHMDSPRESLSHAVTTGTEYGQISELTVVRNLFYDTDHALLSKDGGYITAVNNTIVHTTVAAVNMYEARTNQWQGKGFYGDGNIFYDAAHMFENPDWAGHPTSIIMNNSIFPIVPGDPVVWTGSGNLQDDPQLYNTTNVTDPTVDFMLHPTSPAIGTGPNGQDMGGLVPAGASISGEPPPRTWRNSATLTVGGPEIYGYKYRVNNGPWSGEILRPEPQLPEIPVQPLAPILLTNLPDGTYTVYVIIKNSASVWQSEDEAVASDTWTVDASYSRLVINEVLADNNSAVAHEGTYSDMIELYYDGPTSLALTGIKITDNPIDPNKFVFSGGTMSAGEYLILYADTNTVTLGIHTGFALNKEGDSVYLYDKNGQLLDSVQFGLQLTDLSIGRTGREGKWTLTTPTFGQENIKEPLGNPQKVKINEWLTNGLVLFEEDFIELYNPNSSPVDIGEMYLTDNPVNQQGKCKLSPLSFIDGNGFAVYTADDSNGPGHLNFRLSADTEMIGLFDAQLNEIDKVIYGPQTTDVSYGRAPDGSNNFKFFVLPTPGVSNPAATTTTTTITLVHENATKKVLVPTDSISDNWKGGGAFDDSGWNDATFVSGKTGGVGYDTNPDYKPYISYDVQAKMYDAATKRDTCYIRIPFFILAIDVNSIDPMTLKVRYDDGFLAYINGTPLTTATRNFTGTPAWNSSATNTHSDSAAMAFEPINVSEYIGALRPGNNILAIHALNNSGNRSDFLNSVELEASITEINDEFPYPEALKLLDGLRITELMYHAPEGSEYDYIELKNISNEVLDLNGVRFTEGIDFTFPSMTLNPGQYVVVISNLAAFESEYGTGINVAGQYTGNLSNAGEDIVLRLPVPLEAAILRFRYRDSWYPTTDGSGDALVIRDPSAHPATWGDPESWRAATPSPGGP